MVRSLRFRAPDKALSKIFEALKRAELASTKNSDADATRQPERRRTPRVRVHIPLLVYGYKGKSPFHEDVYTVEVNAHGGLISMQTALRPRQKLLVVNNGNESKQHCIVLSVRVRQKCGFDVAFEFLDPTPRFWQDLEIGGSSRS
jgi:hypothetical protein